MAKTSENVGHSVSVGLHHSQMGVLDVGSVLSCGIQQSVSLSTGSTGVIYHCVVIFLCLISSVVHVTLSSYSVAQHGALWTL